MTRRGPRRLHKKQPPKSLSSADCFSSHGTYHSISTPVTRFYNRPFYSVSLSIRPIYESLLILSLTRDSTSLFGISFANITGPIVQPEPNHHGSHFTMSQSSIRRGWFSGLAEQSSTSQENSEPASLQYHTCCHCQKIEIDERRTTAGASGARARKSAFNIGMFERNTPECVEHDDVRKRVIKFSLPLQDVEEAAKDGCPFWSWFGAPSPLYVELSNADGSETDIRELVFKKQDTDTRDLTLKEQNRSSQVFQVFAQWRGYTVHIFQHLLAC